MTTETTKKKHTRITLKMALRVVQREIDARWEAADSVGDLCRTDHLNSLCEDLIQEFGAI